VTTSKVTRSVRRLQVLRWVASGGFALAVGGLAWVTRAEPGAASQGPPDSITVWVTGCTLGSLRPCGCSGGQLGGIERRASLLRGGPSSHRLVVDTGHWIRQEQEQDLIKARILVRALQLLNYDVICLAAKDVEVAQMLGLAGEMAAAGGVITQDAAGAGIAVPKVFEKSFELDGRRISVHVRATDAQGLVTQLGDPALAGSEGPDDVDLYVVDSPDGPPDVSTAAPARATCVIYAADSDEPRLRGDPNANPLVFSMGRYGRQVVRLQIAAGGPGGGLRLQFGVQAVSEDLPSDPDLVALYKDYQQIVADSGLLGQHSKAPLGRDLGYVGSSACWRCHPYEYAKASPHRHAQAYATLEKAGSHLDPECVVCHVVGLDYEGGFVSARDTPELEGVGCEACHGPGSEHVRTGGKAMTCGPRPKCLDCHSPEHSGQYAGHEKEFLEKMRHWKELRRPARVQP
jgi:hypothetical protein